MDDLKRFGELVGRATALAKEIVPERSIPNFLTCAEIRGGRYTGVYRFSPLGTIWRYGEKGFAEVEATIEKIKNGNHKLLLP